MDSILNTIKKMLGPDEGYTYFDQDIITHINTAFFGLTQMGVGPKAGFKIVDATSVWSDFIPSSDLRYEGVKTYIYQKVKLAFDPPTSSAAAEALKQSISELEWRLHVAAETTIV